ncbi:MAG: hypothetical protein JRE70_11665, partial [Deltaproteobacteria bacterium]|nr:hypothetical protein [Deltaproteobacteria bacterium]
MQTLLGISVRHPMVVILAVLAVTGFFSYQIANPFTREVKLRIDPSFDAILPDDDANRLYYEWVKEEFGDDQSLIIALVMDDVFTLE